MGWPPAWNGNTKVAQWSGRWGLTRRDWRTPNGTRTTLVPSTRTVELVLTDWSEPFVAEPLLPEPLLVPFIIPKR